METSRRIFKRGKTGNYPNEFILTVEYYTVVKMNDLQLYAKIWMNLRNLMLNKKEHISAEFI